MCQRLLKSHCCATYQVDRAVLVSPCNLAPCEVTLMCVIIDQRVLGGSPAGGVTCAERGVLVYVARRVGGEGGAQRVDSRLRDLQMERSLLHQGPIDMLRRFGHFRPQRPGSTLVGSLQEPESLSSSRRWLCKTISPSDCLAQPQREVLTTDSRNCIPEVLIASTTSEGGRAHEALRRLLLAQAGLVGALREALQRGVGVAWCTGRRPPSRPCH